MHHSTSLTFRPGLHPRVKHLALALGACLMLSSAATLAADPVPPAGWTPELMLRLKRVGSVQVSPDGKQVAFTARVAVMEADKSEYLNHIHLGRTDGGPSRQITQGDKSCDDPQWSPDGLAIAFLSSRGGKKNLWLIRPDGGEASQLSNSASDVTSFKWSADGQWLAFTAADAVTADEEQRNTAKNDARVVDENFKQNRLHLIPVTTPPALQATARCLTTGDFNVISDGNRAGRPAFDWSPDGRAIVFAHTRTPAQDDWGTADISLVDVADAKVRPLVHSAAAETSPLFSPDGKSIAYLASDAPVTWGGTRWVRVIGTHGGTARQLVDTPDNGGRYSELIGWSADGGRLFYTEAHGTTLKLLAMSTLGPPQVINTSGGGMSLGGIFLNSTRTHFGFGWEQLDKPYEAFVTSVESFEPTAVSRLHHDLPTIPLGKTEIIRWASSDNMDVEGLLTYPVGYQKGTRYPLLLVVHGGPMGVFTQTFDGTAATYPVAAFAARGYAVLRANVRGSSGYGRKFRYANYGDWGGGDFRDLMTGVDHVIGLGIADADRMGVMGWSYGGFMTSWTITQTKRFKAASVGAGVTNLLSFTGTADIPGFLPDYFAGEFWDKFEAYRAHSPVLQVKGVTTPTLIQHGERDERVPLSQGQELYNALKRQGCKTKMVIYPRTPHGIEEPRLLLDCMQRNLDWFDSHLQPAK